MPRRFNPCAGKSACTEGGTHCHGCGRSHEEIARTRELTGQLAVFVQEMGYENPEDFIGYVAERVRRKLEHSAQRE